MYKVTIHMYGRVQGVGLRWYISRCAENCNVTGTVQNMPDGTVQAELWGDKDQLTKCIEMCTRGPRFSRIDNITSSWEEVADKTDNFRIL